MARMLCNVLRSRIQMKMPAMMVRHHKVRRTIAMSVVVNASATLLKKKIKINRRKNAYRDKKQNLKKDSVVAFFFVFFFFFFQFYLYFSFSYVVVWKVFTMSTVVPGEYVMGMKTPG
jgi:hypothetical protein